MQLQLTNWRVVELSYKVGHNDSRENTFELSTKRKFPEDEPMSFYILFEVKIEGKEFTLELFCTFRFELEEGVTEEFKSSDFPAVNAPAIAFPFIRAYVSNLTLQSGIDPVILPSINFTKIKNKDLSTDN